MENKYKAMVAKQMQQANASEQQFKNQLAAKRKRDEEPTQMEDYKRSKVKKDEIIGEAKPDSQDLWMIPAVDLAEESKTIKKETKRIKEEAMVKREQCEVVLQDDSSPVISDMNLVIKYHSDSPPPTVPILPTGKVFGDNSKPARDCETTGVTQTVFKRRDVRKIRLLSMNNKVQGIMGVIRAKMQATRKVMMP